MALTEIWAMFGANRDLLRDIQSSFQKTTKSNFFNQGTSGMECESDWTRHTKSSAFTAQVIRSATSFMPWSRKIPIGDGYHEFL
ncbi:hypothetical protein M5689_019784 [Euphorbia peplus]|nr:hypothetical protein M5689_019784 [Euphorbia peplus]